MYLRIETTVAEGAVVEVLHLGYLVEDGLVHPAAVAVAAADCMPSEHFKTLVARLA